MSKLHYFQRYSQQENVVTNNTLLLLSRLYAHSTEQFEAFLADLLSTDEPLEVGVRFAQQKSHSKRSVPDGLLEQRSFRVVLETKLHSKPEPDQIARHLDSFGDEDRKVLLVLTPAELDTERREEIEAIVHERGEDCVPRAELVCRTFRKVIRSYGDSLTAHDHEMHDLLNDYEDFCATFRKGELLPRRDYTMRAVSCTNTFDENWDLCVYYEPVSRSSRPHRFLGRYQGKQVKGIGEIENTVAADLLDDGLAVRSFDKQPTNEQLARIENVIRIAVQQRGMIAVTRKHKFRLLENRQEMTYAKQSPGPLRLMKYFDLGEILDTEQLPDIEEIARRLSEKTW